MQRHLRISLAHMFILSPMPGSLAGKVKYKEFFKCQRGLGSAKTHLNSFCPLTHLFPLGLMKFFLIETEDIVSSSVYWTHIGKQGVLSSRSTIVNQCSHNHKFAADLQSMHQKPRCTVFRSASEKVVQRIFAHRKADSCWTRRGKI